MLCAAEAQLDKVAPLTGMDTEQKGKELIGWDKEHYHQQWVLKDIVAE